MIKVIKKEQVEVVRVELEVELTYIDGELQKPMQSFTAKDIETLLSPEVEEDEEDEEDEELGNISSLSSVVSD